MPQQQELSMRLKREMKWCLVMATAMSAGLGGHAWAQPAPTPAAPVAAAPPAGLALASSDPVMVISVSSMQGVSERLSRLNDSALIDIAPLSDVVGQIRSALRVTKGLREDGPMAVVAPVGSAAALTAGFDWNALTKAVVLPTNDYTAFVTALGGDPAAAGSTAIHPIGERPGFARSLPGGFLVLGGQKEVVDSYTSVGAGASQLLTNAGTAGARVLNSADITIYLNMQALGPAISKSITASFEESDRVLEAASKGSDPAGYVIKRVWSRMYGDAVRAFIRDTSVMVIGIELTEAGIVFNVTAQFKPGSFTATAMAGNGDVTGLMAKFPQDAFSLAFVTNTKALGIKQLFEEAAARCDGPEGATPESALLKKAANVVDKARSIGHVSYAAQPGNSSEPSLWLLETTDPKAFIAAFRDFVTAFPEYQPMVKLPKSMGGTGETAGKGKGETSPFKPGSSYSPNVLQIDGSPVDQYELTFAAPEGFLKSLPTKVQPFFAEMATGGRTGYLSSFNNIVVVSTSPDAQIVRQALLAARQTTGLGSEGAISEVRTLQIAKPNFEGFVSLSAASKMAIEWLGHAHPMPAMQFPPTLGPISISGATEAGGVTVRVILTTYLLQFISENRSWYAAAFVPPASRGGKGLAEPLIKKPVKTAGADPAAAPAPGPAPAPAPAPGPAQPPAPRPPPKSPAGMMPGGLPGGPGGGGPGGPGGPGGAPPKRP
jgi:hypothetical protein